MVIVNTKSIIGALCICFMGITQGAWAQVLINVSPSAELKIAFADFQKNPKTPVALTQAFDFLQAPELRGINGELKDDITIQLEGGTYHLTSTLKLDAASSGSANHLVTIQGPKNGSAILTGGHEIGGFKSVTDQVVLNRLTPVARSHVLQTNLLEQGITDFGIQERHGYGDAGKPTAIEFTYRNQPMVRARWPNHSFAKISSTPDGLKGLKFTLQDANISAWKGEPSLLGTGYWFQDWADTTTPIKTIDLVNKHITLSGPNLPYGMKIGQRVFIQNALSELDQPGEWYLDTTNGLLYAWIPESSTQPFVQSLSRGSDLKNVEKALIDHHLEASILNKLLVIDNASYIRINNITFQSARGDAISVQGGHKIAITHSIIRNVGNRAAVISGQDNGLTDMLIENVGEGGVVLKGGDRQKLTPANLYIERSNIRNFSRVSRTIQPAVLLSGVGNRVEANKISGGPHSAIIFTGNDHIISHNEIYDVCKETGDSGAIYTGRDWTARGTVISYNHLHDIPHNISWGGTKGIYLDDLASGIIVKGNVFDEVYQAVFIGGGRDNLVDDNTFHNGEISIFLDSRGNTWQKAMVEDQEGTMHTRLKAVPYNLSPYKEHYPNLANILEDEPNLPKYNIARRNQFVGNAKVFIDKGAESGLNLNLIDNNHYVDFLKN